ncbi:MAG: hypothetical protein CSA62_08585 [Planctomycetota bacterium]|nr:MAG: hypothetical protein CSA62_08585 [Planctomycetota bacterium]
MSLLSKLTDILGSDAPAQVLIQLVVAQFLLAQGYPAPGLDEGDWADWQLPGGEICFVQSVGVGLEFCP